MDRHYFIETDMEDKSKKRSHDVMNMPDSVENDMKDRSEKCLRFDSSPTDMEDNAIKADKYSAEMDVDDINNAMGSDDWGEDWNWEEEFPRDDCSENECEDQILSAEYVKDHFDELYVDPVVRWVEDKKNVFITGSPGRGKSTCTNKVIQRLYSKGTRLVVTGSTGAATVNIGHDALKELTEAIEKVKRDSRLNVPWCDGEARFH